MKVPPRTPLAPAARLPIHGPPPRAAATLGPHAPMFRQALARVDPQDATSKAPGPRRETPARRPAIDEDRPLTIGMMGLSAPHAPHAPLASPGASDFAPVAARGEAFRQLDRMLRALRVSRGEAAPMARLVLDPAWLGISGAIAVEVRVTDRGVDALFQAEDARDLGTASALRTASAEELVARGMRIGALDVDT